MGCRCLVVQSGGVRHEAGLPMSRARAPPTCHSQADGRGEDAMTEFKKMVAGRPTAAIHLSGGAEVSPASPMVGAPTSSVRAIHGHGKRKLHGHGPLESADGSRVRPLPACSQRSVANRCAGVPRQRDSQQVTPALGVDDHAWLELGVCRTLVGRSANPPVRSISPPILGP